MADWINNPRYQRVIQRLQTMQPWQRAIFTSAGADRQFASDEMRNKINALNAASIKSAREKTVSTGKERLALSRDRFNFGKKLSDKEWDINKADRRLGKYIGYGNIGVSGLLGYQQGKLAGLQADQEQAMRKRILGLSR